MTDPTPPDLERRHAPPPAPCPLCSGAVEVTHDRPPSLDGRGFARRGFRLDRDADGLADALRHLARRAHELDRGERVRLLVALRSAEDRLGPIRPEVW